MGGGVLVMVGVAIVVTRSHVVHECLGNFSWP